jgi:hypothetical protein
MCLLIIELFFLIYQFIYLALDKKKIFHRKIFHRKIFLTINIIASICRIILINTFNTSLITSSYLWIMIIFNDIQQLILLIYVLLCSLTIVVAMLYLLKNVFIYLKYLKKTMFGTKRLENNGIEKIQSFLKKNNIKKIS